MNHTPSHRIEMAQVVIVGGFLVFIAVVALFVLDLRFTGRAVDTTTTAYILNSTPAGCNVTLVSGYNLISVPCITTAELLNDVMPNASIVAMYQYVPGDTDPWKVYNPNLPSYVISDLSYLSRRVGYVVIANASYYNHINGSEPAYTNIPIVQGWSLIGYPSLKNRNASDVFFVINTSVTKVVTYDTSTASFIDYPAGTLVLITPGRGYWVNSTQNTGLTVYP